MAEKPDATRILHCFAAPTRSGSFARALAVIGRMGRDHVHDIVIAKGEFDKGLALPKAARVRWREDFPQIAGRPTPGRLVAIAQAMKPYDLVLTYDWGAMNAVMAHTVFAQALGLPALIHHENGDGDGPGGHSTRRKWFRRVAFGRTDRVIVPGPILERRARQVWKVPPARIARVSPGIDTAAWGRKPKPKALRLVKRKGERWIGIVVDLDQRRHLRDLVQACAKLPENWHLVIIGEGPDRDAIADAASDLRTSDRVHLPGPVDDPTSVIGLFDVYADPVASDGIAPGIIEAMAAGLPVAMPDAGETPDIVSQANEPFLTPHGNKEALARALEALARDEDLRSRIGTANRELACERFDEARMVARYRDLYEQALGGQR